MESKSKFSLIIDIYWKTLYPIHYSRHWRNRSVHDGHPAPDERRPANM